MVKRSSTALPEQGAGGEALSGPPLGPLHLRITTLTSLSQFRPKLPATKAAAEVHPSSASAPAPSMQPHGDTNHHATSRALDQRARGRVGLKSHAVTVRAQSSSSATGSEASDSSSSSLMQVRP